jgi:mono/diheme cytochrome c family protein
MERYLEARWGRPESGVANRAGLESHPAMNRKRASLSTVAVLLLVVAACTGKYVRKTTDEKVEPTRDRLQRGAYLVENVAACGGCHTMRDSGKIVDPERPDALLAGGNVLETSEPKMRLWVPNITSDPDTGIGKWSDDQVMRAIRDGVDDEGNFLVPVMPFGSFQYMSDDDVRAVVAYLRAVPPFRQTRKPIHDEVPFLVRVALYRFGVAMHRPVHDVREPGPGDPVKQGEYVARIAACADCHSLGKRGPRSPDDRFLAGSDVPFPEGGKVWAANLTPDPETGLGRYNREQVKKAIRAGVRLDGKKMAPPMALLTPHYTGLTDADLDAVVEWLFAQKPVKNAVPARQLDDATRARLGQD